MSLMQIRQRTREQTGDQYEIASEDEPLLNDYINEGLQEICAGRLLQTADLSVMGGSANLTDLPGFVRALSLREESGREIPFETRENRLYTSCDGAFVLSYLGAPGLLLADTDEPPIPQSSHGALADYAAWRVLGSGGTQAQSRAQFYLARFERARRTLDSWLEGRMGASRLRNKYL